jgi:hypothetical protein
MFLTMMAQNLIFMSTGLLKISTHLDRLERVKKKYLSC